MDLRTLIRDVPDFPSPGILFRDITPLLAHPQGLREVTEHLLTRYASYRLDKVVGIESRGFIFGAPVAEALSVGFIPARKPGKLPWTALEESYALEYGTNTLCLHADAIAPGERVLIIDDVIATGGTLAAARRLVERLGGEVVEITTIVELTFLKGRNVIPDVPFYSMLQY